MESISRDYLKTLAKECEEDLKDTFSAFESVSMFHTEAILDAFREYRVSEACFMGTTGYGYDDLGRETLENIFSRIFKTDAALVRANFVNGTHAIACMLYGALKKRDYLLSVTGTPYDTLLETITGESFLSLKKQGIVYGEISLSADGGPDYDMIRLHVKDIKPAAVYIQHSRGYGSRRALYIDEIKQICDIVHEYSPKTVILMDNCYCEFCEIIHPTEVGVDVMAGSLIKNPGGGIAPCGGYIVGKKEIVDRAAERLTVPGIGGECGATLGTNRMFYQGLFMAPHTVAQALKTVAFCAAMLERLGFESFPKSMEPRADIVQTIKLKSADNLVKFCAGIQHGSPVDSFASPQPAPMPGYSDQVVMAAGTFIQGASIELSCDGPIREPYLGYVQGGLTYESGRYGIIKALESMFL